ncbi:hypothetical protein N7491_010650 [Penicillium cf. griseofulvum]|uniref:N-acetylgalactosaminide beta-1,3-galactosyltransferase n=1 Tax=Penicillium cf. griseofulvum TaxID=2972120 RepID=A0A9W9N068_9EURO|nr:hypothetical protein N7472_000978 [Penicillium cf. griseofulvum]KAJ5422205.1 hypothetical protein N7491_010650 [Penicillium cf. griseofulvum]KAJ5428390.1 hypothetical protein N7445_009844 [Penicillium cf. griseofulvum]
MVPRRSSRRLIAVASVIALFFLYHISSFSSHNRQWQPHFTTTTEVNPVLDENGEPAPFCPPLPGIEDVLVVMKTGVTESREKVPIHFNTTLRCVPNFVIYSDFEEEIEGVKIHDVLRDMDSSAKNNPDFDFYHRILKYGRKGLEQQDFADEANSALGKPNNPGWKLDKWKFLPMAQEALRYKPDAKWFIFVEADTYISWPTVLTWLAQFDHTKPHYLGTETQIADVIFAHGGSGFMLSNPALQRVSDEYTTREVELNQYTDNHWAGDCVLGKVLSDAGVNLHFTWPIIQNSNIGELDEFTTDFYRKPWCFIAVSLHHLSPTDIENLWKFEQKRWRDKNKHILLHGDLFREYISTEISSQPKRQNWNNMASDDQPFAKTFEDCRLICETEKTCVQFAFREDKCYTSHNPRLGNPVSGDATSGWIPSRIRDMTQKMGLCRKPDFGD